ncbi:hypothetical protein [Streptosporangium lutulentum]|uniref:Cellulose biosynthesis protein BcsQ n=1 Tax=Streptosporangium lutulentum TaxID=1461250 RepID=A0ABT9QUA4_9ACTN|nr:hypothetical protein [Streptosporangium lutulentum]MDP9850345.1 cellulose biosynthesis protein BcsQ [Streptosporangium lutulentum]
MEFYQQGGIKKTTGTSRVLCDLDPQPNVSFWTVPKASEVEGKFDLYVVDVPPSLEPLKHVDLWKHL